MRGITTLIFVACALLTLGCTRDYDRQVGEENSYQKAMKSGFAEAQLFPKSGSDVSGTVNFVKDASGAVKAVISIRNASPGKHGFHIHSKGDCSASDGSSAGGHFNPSHVQHGGPDDPIHHYGDMGNLIVDSDGNADVEIELAAGANGVKASEIIGRAVILHGGSDDLHSQPSGDAGARIACGVIRAKDSVRNAAE